MRWSAVPPKGPVWRKWFAWYPVRIGDEWVWLEMVERTVLGQTEYGPIVDYRNRPPRPYRKGPSY